MEQLSEALILLNVHEITNKGFGSKYDLVVDEQMNIVESIEQLPANNYTPVASQLLVDRLFELSHVNINPYIDNSLIVTSFTSELEKIGVVVSNKPANDSIAMCYKPIGDLSCNVRLKVGSNNKLILVSTKLQIVK